MSRTVLVIEDEPAIRELLTECLIDAGYGVTCAADGYEALEVLERSRPDAILTDIRLPGLHGPEFIASLRRRGNGIPIILVTGCDPSAVPPDLPLLSKPFNLHDLVSTIAMATMES